MSYLFENIGGKIKVSAGIFFVFVIVGIIAGLITMLVLENVAGFFIILIIGVFSIPGLFLMYAMGEIVEQLQKQSFQNEKMVSALGAPDSKSVDKESDVIKNAPPRTAARPLTYNVAPGCPQPRRNDGDWFCTNCGKGNINAVTSCQYCGKGRR